MTVPRFAAFSVGTLILAANGLNGCSLSETPVMSGTRDTIEATPSAADTVVVVSGGSRAFNLTFNSSDANSISNLSVTSGLSALPAGWSGPTAFTCPKVSTGSGCVLTLTYAPTTASNGSLTITYGYQDNFGQARTGSTAIPYASTMHDTVTATPAPGGQINAVLGASQAVQLTFTTDDGTTATNLTLVGSLAGLPGGWTSPHPGFACPTVSTGGGCLLPLSFTPNAVGAGSLTLNFSYLDNAGVTKSGAVRLPYAATSNNNIVAAAAPSGQVNAFIGGTGQTVSVAFTTDDHNPAASLAVTTDLTALPDGWSTSQSSFACDSVSTGNGCVLQLRYAPSAPATGTLILNYDYRDDAGEPKNGSFNVAYAGTQHNNVVGASSPAGQINAVAGTGAQPVLVNFTTDHGTATGLSLTTALGTLPSGWTSTATAFSCATLGNSGNACQLPLTYAPGAAGSGTLILNYNYTNDAGTTGTGAVTIPYASTVHDTVTGATTPSGTVSVPVSSSQSVTVVFTTSDGNGAGDLAIASSGGGSLASLPGGWSAAGGATAFTCGSISTGTGCALALTYAPTASANGSLALNFTYLDNAGTAQTGSVSIAFAATAQHAYVSDSNNGLYLCAVDGTTGTLANCQLTGGGFNGAWSVAFFSGSSADYAYVVDGRRANVFLCLVAGDGTLSSCVGQSAQSGYFVGAEHAGVLGSRLYTANQAYVGSDVVTVCSISAADGTLSDCAFTAPGSGLHYASGVALDGSFAFVATDNDGLFACGFDSTTGNLSSCVPASASGSPVNTAWNVAVSGSNAYLANAGSGLTTCAVDGASALSLCSDTSLASGFPPMATGVALNAGYAYVSTFSMFFGTGNVYRCPINGLSVSACTPAVSDGSGSGFSRSLTDVIIH